MREYDRSENSTSRWYTNLKNERIVWFGLLFGCCGAKDISRHVGRGRVSRERV